MSRPLIIDNSTRQRIIDLKERAALAATPYEAVKAMAERRAHEVVPETNPDNAVFTIRIPHGYCVTYTHEHQRPDCTCAHISISVEGARPGFGPSVEAVTMIMQEFGFRNGPGALPGWMSRGEDGRTIVEFVEPLDGNVERLRREH
jgi:hypothetical protein